MFMLILSVLAALVMFALIIGGLYATVNYKSYTEAFDVMISKVRQQTRKGGKRNNG